MTIKSVFSRLSKNFFSKKQDVHKQEVKVQKKHLSNLEILELIPTAFWMGEDLTMKDVQKLIINFDEESADIIGQVSAMTA